MTGAKRDPGEDLQGNSWPLAEPLWFMGGLVSVWSEVGLGDLRGLFQSR